ncbi:MAG: hypothetical protein Q4P29_02725 [Tissierellia bacterium]|nr:hypothetical protein [Tissierellia bacterium]
MSNIWLNYYPHILIGLGIYLIVKAILDNSPKNETRILKIIGAVFVIFGCIFLYLK